MSIKKALEHAANIKALCNWHNGTSIQKFDDIEKEIDSLERELKALSEEEIPAWCSEHPVMVDF